MKNSLSHDPVVIIGGGVAGLTAANLLARDGFRVAIHEAASKLGGSCASTRLAGYTFNDGAVYLAVISVVDHVFQKLGLNRAELLPLRKITSISSTILPDGTVVNLGEGLDVTVTGRTADRNRLKDELRRMVDKWQPVLRFAMEELLLHPFSPWLMLRKGWRHLPKFHGTVASELRRAFSDDAFGVIRSSQDLQPPQSREFQHAKSDYLYLFQFWHENLGHGWAITSTSTASRQIQFGLKLIW